MEIENLKAWWNYHVILRMIRLIRRLHLTGIGFCENMQALERRAIIATYQGDLKFVWKMMFGFKFPE